MNNLIVAAAVITAAGLLLFSEARQRASLEWKNRNARQELRMLEAQSENLDAVLVEARSRLSRQRDNLADAKAGLQPAPSPAARRRPAR